MCSPSQVLGDVYTEVLEAAYPLHRGPTDHKRSVGQQVSLSEVHNQLFSFAHIQRETVVLAPRSKMAARSDAAAAPGPKDGAFMSFNVVCSSPNSVNLVKFGKFTANS